MENALAHRRGEFVHDCRRVLSEREEISDASVFLNDISGTFFQVNIDYFTTPIPIADFNQIKQQINLDILSLVERRKLVFAGSGMTVKLSHETVNG